MTYEQYQEYLISEAEDLPELIFETYEECVYILDEMGEELHLCGQTSIATLLWFAGMPKRSFLDDYFGWFDISDVKIIKETIQEGIYQYRLSIPTKPQRIFFAD